MATIEQVVETATDFLLKSPPGEFTDVLHNLRRLLADESILNSTIFATCREYNTEHLLVVPSNEAGTSTEIIISKYAELDADSYLDPRTAHVVFFDHITRQIIGSRPAEADEIDTELEPYRAAFDVAAGEYIKEHYINGASAVYVQRAEGGNIVVAVIISSSKHNPHNFWNGRWCSTWICTFNVASPVVICNGNIEIDAHYFEEGNVQMNARTPLSVTVTAADQSGASLAQAALAQICQAEAAYQNDLDTHYRDMDGTTFKALRRMLPITRSKVDWEKVMQYKLAFALEEYTTD